MLRSADLRAASDGRTGHATGHAPADGHASAPLYAAPWQCVHTLPYALLGELTRRQTVAVPPPGFRPGMPPPGFVPGSAHPLCALQLTLNNVLTLPRRARSAAAWFPPRDAPAWRVSAAGRLSPAGLSAPPAGSVKACPARAKHRVTPGLWCSDVVTHSSSQCPSDVRYVRVAA